MTCPVLTPWWRSRAGDPAPAANGSVRATPVLDHESLEVRALTAEVRQAATAPLHQLRAAHRPISERVRPVYAVNDTQPASTTLRRGRGSCSQRLAVLEAVARSLGVPTRVRGILVDGSFWYPRFPRLRRLVPSGVVLAWPELLLAGEWLPVSELFGSLQELAGSSGFTNADGETLFDAIGRIAIDWDGCTSVGNPASRCDLSAAVLRELGRFEDRDDLFSEHGQTLCLPARLATDPILSRWSPDRLRSPKRSSATPAGR